MKIQLRHRAGRCVEYLDSTGKWKSTRCTDKEKARAVALSIMDNELMTFGDFVDDMFNSKERMSWYGIMKDTGKLKDISIDQVKTYAKLYVIPFFKNFDIHEITPMLVQNWYMTIRKKDGELVSPTTAGHALAALDKIMKYAIFKGHITLNPCKAITTIRYESEGYPPFTDSELERMFPEDRIELCRIYGDITAALCFLVMKETGFRPGEAISITDDCYYPEYRAILTSQSYDSKNKTIKKDIKTTGRGFSTKFGRLSEFTHSIMMDVIKHNGHGPVFLNRKGNIFSVAFIRDRLTRALEILGIEKGERAPYSFRSTFYTKRIQHQSKDAVLMLMGDKRSYRCYDQRSNEEIIRQLIAFEDSSYINRGGEENLNTVSGK